MRTAANSVCYPVHLSSWRVVIDIGNTSTLMINIQAIFVYSRPMDILAEFAINNEQSISVRWSEWDQVWPKQTLTAHTSLWF